jgi:hypothetical protein
MASGVIGNQLVVVIRNAGFRRDAGKMARALFGNVGSTGGHKDSARAVIPLENINCGSGSEADCRKYMVGLIRKSKLN